MTKTQAAVVGLAGAAYLFSGALGWYIGKERGIKEGLDMFHEACYTGGIVVNKNTGKVIQCSPLSPVPEAELPKFFPKGG